MHEPAVAITDYIFGVQALIYAVYIFRRAPRSPWLLFMLGVATAALVGGSVHAFQPDNYSPVFSVLWRITLIAIGTMTLAGWYIGSALLPQGRGRIIVRGLAIVQFLVFVPTVALYVPKFTWAAINYLPAALFLLIMFSYHYIATRERAVMWGAIGLCVAFVGAFVQLMHIAPSPKYFDHNALYHVFQIIALGLIFITANWQIASASTQN